MNIDTLKMYADFMKQHGITVLRAEGIEIVMPPPAPKFELPPGLAASRPPAAPPKLTEAQKDALDDHMLFGDVLPDDLKQYENA